MKKIFDMPFIPQREEKPRNTGVTMVMDKGLSSMEAKSMVEVAGHLIDFVKLGFGTSMVSNPQAIASKISIYHEAGIRVYLGGTLFEAFIARNLLNEYISTIHDLGINTVEVSDGSIRIEHSFKCQLIEKLSKEFFVLSEVGSKRSEVNITPDEWISEMQNELKAGASYVITEAREGGNIGIFNSDGSPKKDLINRIQNEVETTRVLWEAPLKNQQIFFIKHFGANVNLGNINHQEIIALETLRTGLRGDTFFDFLPESFQHLK